MQRHTSTNNRILMNVIIRNRRVNVHLVAPDLHNPISHLFKPITILLVCTGRRSLRYEILALKLLDCCGWGGRGGCGGAREGDVLARLLPRHELVLHVRFGRSAWSPLRAGIDKFVVILLGLSSSEPS